MNATAERDPAPSPTRRGRVGMKDDPWPSCPPPILARGLIARLDAIVRRHGGTPKPLPEKRIPVFAPWPKRGHCRGQLKLW